MKPIRTVVSLLLMAGCASTEGADRAGAVQPAGSSADEEFAIRRTASRAGTATFRAMTTASASCRARRSSWRIFVDPGRR